MDEEQQTRGLSTAEREMQQLRSMTARVKAAEVLAQVHHGRGTETEFLISEADRLSRWFQDLPPRRGRD